MKEVIVSEGQTIQDIAVQVYGSAENTIDLVTDNNLDGVASEVQAGRILKVRETTNRVAEYFANRQKQVNSGGLPNEFRVTGIGYMEITPGSPEGIFLPFVVS
jgi:hypothetical protein